MFSRALRTTRPFSLHSTPPSSRLFTTTPLRSIKEDSSRSPQELEAEKQKQLKAQEQGKATWNENLASAGEASITADRQQVGDHGEHMEELQKQTAGQAEKEHPEGKKE